MQTDGQTDMTKLIVIFHNFANVPKNVLLVDKFHENQSTSSKDELEGTNRQHCDIINLHFFLFLGRKVS
jgi:hypothetical protein